MRVIRFSFTLILLITFGITQIIYGQSDKNTIALFEQAEYYWGANEYYTDSLLKIGANPNAQNEYGQTPAHVAVSNSYNQTFFKLLFYYGAKFDIKDKDGKTALELAREQYSGSPYVSFLEKPYLDLIFYCTYGKAEEVKKYVIAHPDSVNVPDENGHTPIFMVVRRQTDAEELTTYLIEKGADVNPDFLNMMDITIDTENKKLLQVILNKFGTNIPSTPLCYAADKQSFELVKILVEAGAELNPDIEEYRPPDWACGKSWRNWEPRRVKPEIIEYLLDKGANINAGEATHFASQALNADTILPLLFKRGANPNDALFNAAETYDQRLASYALAAGADVDKQNSEGKTPIMSAAKRNNTSILQTLIQKTKNIDATDSQGNTALHIAASSGAVQTTNVLIEHSANVSAKNNAGATPLLNAIVSQHVNSLIISQTLIKNGAKPNETIFFATNNPALPYAGSYAAAAAYTGNNQVLTYLLDEQKLPADAQSYNPADNTNSGPTPFQCAFEQNQEKTMLILLDHGANPNQKNSGGKSALEYAMLNGKNLLFSKLIEKNVIVNISDSEKNTPLHFAVKNDDVKTLQTLLATGAGVNSQNTKAETPLHTALNSEHPNYELLSFLRSAGADPHLKNKQGQSPADIVAQNYYRDDTKRRIAIAIGIKPELFTGNGLIRNKLTIENHIPLIAEYFSPESLYNDLYFATNNISDFDISEFFMRRLTDSTKTYYADYNPYPLYKSMPPIKKISEIKSDIGIGTDTVLIYDENSGETVNVAFFREGEASELSGLLSFDNWSLDEQNFKLNKQTEAYAVIRRYQHGDDWDYTGPLFKKTAYILPEEFKHERKAEKVKRNAVKLKQIKYEVSLGEPIEPFDDRFKENLEAPYLNRFAREKLRSNIFDAVLTNTKPAYDFQTGLRLSPSEILERMGERTDTIYDIDPETGELIPIIAKRLMNESEIKSLIFIEEWSIDTVSMHIFKEIVGVAPVRISYTDDDFEMTSPKKSIVFAVFFNTIDPKQFEPKPFINVLPLFEKSDIESNMIFPDFFAFEQNEKFIFDWAKVYRSKAENGEIPLHNTDISTLNRNFSEKDYKLIPKNEVKAKFTEGDELVEGKTVGIQTHETWYFDAEAYTFTKEVFAYALFSKYLKNDDPRHKLNGFVLNHPETLNPSDMKHIKSLKYEVGYDDYYRFTESLSADFENDKPLFYNQFSTQKFKDIIMEDILTGKITAFDTETKSALNIEQFNGKLVADSILIETINSDIGELTLQLSPISVNSDNIKSLIFEEDWYLNTETLQLQKIVRSISPVFYYPEAEDGEYRKMTPFYIVVNRPKK